MPTDLDNSLGKVLASINSAAYTTTGGDRFNRGQCTWYCCGRAKEKYGVNLSPLLPAPANGGQWFSKIITNGYVTKRPAALGPVANCVASFAHKECGHVVYVEKVDNGFVYFTEYNWNQNLNGRLQKIEIDRFPKLHGCKLNGYIVIRNFPPIIVIDRADCNVVSGWALGAERVDIYHDNNIGLGSCNSFSSRPDVAKVHGNYPNAGQCGYYLNIAGKLSKGRHTIKVAAIGKNNMVQWQFKDINI
jgi:surface antigen